VPDTPSPERTAPPEPAPAATGTAPPQPPGEVGGPTGPEPTRFGDWEKDGRCSDF
jgi:hypothetical protein